MPAPRRPARPAAAPAGADTRNTPDTPERIAPERIAKVLARAGVASRRDAEEMVRAGRVAVNGRRLDSPATTVTPADRITVDGAPLPEPERARLWLYHKPAGLVTTARDEQGRPTVFDNLPPGLPRVMPIGRLDLNSEGLLLLTNDGALKRRLELPSTGWMRRYRVRVHGSPTEAQLAPLRAGLTLGDERFQPMVVSIDRQQGANAWLTVGLREGRNREVRRAMEAVGLTVNRLIRISFGPFQLGDLAPGAVEEVRARVLRDQLGGAAGDPPAAGPARRPRPGAGTGPTRAPADAGARPDPGAAAPVRRSWGSKSHGSAPRPPRPGPEGRGAEVPDAADSGAPRSWGTKAHGPPAAVRRAPKAAAGSGAAPPPASGAPPGRGTKPGPAAAPGGAAGAGGTRGSRRPPGPSRPQR